MIQDWVLLIEISDAKLYALFSQFIFYRRHFVLIIILVW